MTPKEKAKDLVNKFYCQKDDLGLSFCVNYSNATAAAKIAVDEILEMLRSFSSINKLDYDYWIAVKQEILKS